MADNLGGRDRTIHRVFFLVQITATVGWEVRHQQTYQQQINCAFYSTLVHETPHFGTRVLAIWLQTIGT